MSIAEQTKKKMYSAIEHFKQELKTLRTNRANPAMLDTISVEVYGASARLRDIARVSSPEPRQLLISPHDPKNVHSIAKGIERANIGLMPIVDSTVVRINVPPMDASMRKEIAKQAKKKAEDAKVVVRELRRQGNELVRKQKSSGDITEDLMKKEEKLIQEHTDISCKEIDDLMASKEKEILSV